MLTLSAAGLPARVADDTLSVIWAKVAFNCVMNTLCTIVDEVAAVARAEGVFVDKAAALRLMTAQSDPSASGSHLASTLQDLMNGRRTEIAHLNGAIAARAAEHGLDAPLNALITQLIQLLEATWPQRVNRLHPDTQ